MIDSVLRIAIDAARQGGDILRRGRADGVAVEAKGATDVVTEIDRRSERAIVAAILQAFPDHGILGEEGAARPGAGAWRWLVDPLDGTKNYAHGSARCAVSIGVEHEGRMVVGVVYAPFGDALHVAVAGRGAWCGDVPARVSSTTSLREAMIATAFCHLGDRLDPVQAARTARVFAQARAVRVLGCAALDLCDVAHGRLDAYFEPGLQPWDTAAGALIVREAGGVVTDFGGAPHTPEAPTLLATNGGLHDALRADMQDASPERAS